MKKYYLVGSTVLFLVVFNVGFVFHDIVFGEWFHSKLEAIAREEYIVPLIALAFVLYSGIQTFLFPIFYSYASTHYNWNPIKTGVVFGGLMGFFWDALQGGIIEVATFQMPFAVFALDSTYHTLEGCLAGFIAALVYTKTVLRTHEQKTNVPAT